jgi:hypothetical protein
MKKILLIIGFLAICLLTFSQRYSVRSKFIDSYDISEGDTVFNWYIYNTLKSWNIHLEWSFDTTGQNIKIRQTNKPNATSSDYLLYPNMDSLVIDTKTGNQEFQDLDGFGGEYIQMEIDTTITTTGTLDAWITEKWQQY